LCLSVSAMLLAYPLALGICCFVHGAGPARAARPLVTAVRFMTSVPTVVYGLVSVFLLVPLIRNAFSGSGFSWLAAGLVLAVLVIPTIVLVIDGQFRQVQNGIGLTGIALGLGPIQQLLRLTLPLSAHGLGVAAALGFGRAVGDTLIPLMLAGNAARPPHSLLDPMRTLTSHIALVVATDSQSLAYGSLFACGVVLFLVSLLVNLALRGLRVGHD
ncbi:MAG: ABC transporter permease subunit, partial [Propionivibrio sp.]